jgi:hypothetical protein
MIYLVEFQLFNDVDGRHHRVLNVLSDSDTFRRIVDVTNPNATYHRAIVMELIQGEYQHLRIENLQMTKMLTDFGSKNAVL